MAIRQKPRGLGIKGTLNKMRTTPKAAPTGRALKPAVMPGGQRMVGASTKPHTTTAGKPSGRGGIAAPTGPTRGAGSLKPRKVTGTSQQAGKVGTRGGGSGMKKPAAPIGSKRRAATVKREGRALQRATTSGHATKARGIAKGIGRGAKSLGSSARAKQRGR